MARVLDRKRDFGVVCGGGGVCYEQDGLLFDAHDDLVGAEPLVDSPEDAFPAPPTKKSKAAEKADPGVTLLDDQLAAQTEGL